MMEQSAAATAEACEPVSADSANTPAHLIRLDETWALWRWVGLRGAGFPIAQLSKLAAPETAKAADAILEAESAGNNGREQPAPLWSDFKANFKAEALLISQAIKDAATSKTFREAIIWQNRNALHGSIEALLRMPEQRDVGVRDRRRREEAVASYVQRYCAKNDTIGFFGPVGWAELASTGDLIQAQPGETLLAQRDVYFEVWCIDKLAQVLAANGTSREWIAPRRASYIDLAGTRLYFPSRGAINLPLNEAAALRACDGCRTAKEIAKVLVANPLIGIKSAAEAYALLEKLEQRAWIVWKFEVPMELFPERTLRRGLEQIADDAKRELSLAALTELELARDCVARAAGDDQELDAAIGNLEETFTRLTGSASTRSPGEMYAARTLVYEDCRRDLDLELGPQVTASLAPSLCLLLTSARWFSYQIANIARGWFNKLYAEISARTRSRTIDFTTFWYQISPLVLTDQRAPLNVVLLEVQKKWDQILSLPAGTSRVEYTSEELREAIATAFDSPRAGWEAAIYHSPDIMIAAESIDAIRRGDYQFVLGEIHATVNTIGTHVFVEHHPQPREFLRNFVLDRAEPKAVPLVPKVVWPSQSSRLMPVYSPHDYIIEFVPEPADVPHSQIVQFGSLVVEDQGKGPMVRTRDGRLQFDPLDLLTVTPTLSVGNDFKLLARVKHRPRITIDRLVVERETWCFQAAEIEFAEEKDEASRFLAARRWAREQGMPRFVFIKSPIEVKPVFVDFDSPVYLNILSKMVRKGLRNDCSDFVFTEMLPTPGQCWLPDANGQKYASELRFIAVDLGY
jgi:Lantibiotic dehydratase, C terminus./Lantibiotic dehydratase, N terminus.